MYELPDRATKDKVKLRGDSRGGAQGEIAVRHASAARDSHRQGAQEGKRLRTRRRPEAPAPESGGRPLEHIDRPDRLKTIPPLVAGQRLDRATFHERYEAMPPRTRAELIGGVVHMPSPVSREHSQEDSDAGFWLNFYRFRTPGVEVGHNATTMLDEQSELQPDLMLMIREEHGGQIHGPIITTGRAELVIEIGKSSRRLDLGLKKDDYERAGVQEYLFLGIDPDEVAWFIRRNNRFEACRLVRTGFIDRYSFPVCGWIRSAVFWRSASIDRGASRGPCHT